MKANFFNQVAAMKISGDLQITVRTADNGAMAVSVMILNEQCTDKAKIRIPPFQLKGTAAEMDEGFFTTISQPLKATESLLSNMTTYMLQLQTAKKYSAEEVAKTSKAKTETDSKEKQYKEVMAKVEELTAAGKFREAWAKVPNASTFPEHTEDIRAKKAFLNAKFEPDLFAGVESGQQEPSALTTPVQQSLVNTLPEDEEEDETPEDDDQPEETIENY